MELEWILGKALAKSTDRRYQSAVEFSVDLETLLAKLQTGASTAARSTVRAGVFAPPPRLESVVAAPGPAAETSVEIQLQQRRRRARDLLLDLGGQGLLPDRVLSQALELLGKPLEQMQPADKRRDELLAELLESRRVGEFIENWQQAGVPAPSLVRHEQPVEPSPLPAHAPSPVEPLEAGPHREWRTQAEIFGLPLIHCVRGIDPRTGKRRVAKGIVALGDIAIGLVACGGVAIGGLALGGVSFGLLAAGGCALGLVMSAGAVALGPEAFGAVTFSLAGDSFFSFALRAAFAFLVLRLLIRRRRFRKRYGSDGGAVGVWSVLGGREWRSDGTPFRGGNVVATFGACDVDLTGTALAGPEVVIEATAMFGGVKIIVPYGWRIVTHGSQLFGAYVNKTRPPQSAGSESAPRLLVKGFALFGGVEVTHPAP
jgi:hypothetical protein